MIKESTKKLHEYAGMLYSHGKAAIHCVMVVIVCILYLNNGRCATVSCVSVVNMINQSGLWCSWVWHTLKLDIRLTVAEFRKCKISSLKSPSIYHTGYSTLCHMPQQSSQQSGKCCYWYTG